MPNLTSQIIKHTALSRRHLTPELTLRLVTSSCPLWRAKEDEVPFKDPFWAFYWPGGQASARYILDNKNEIKDRRVLDVGCGCGAGSIAAAMTKAKRVVANDIDPCALLATNLNAELNGVDVETCEKNYIDTECKEFDVILIGDMFYDEHFANYLFNWLSRLSRGGKTILIGDPGRHGLTEKRRNRMSLLAKYKLTEEGCDANNGFTDTSVWKLNQF